MGKGEESDSKILEDCREGDEEREFEEYLLDAHGSVKLREIIRAGLVFIPSRKVLSILREYFPKWWEREKASWKRDPDLHRRPR